MTKTQTPGFTSWADMLRRCLNPKHRAYRRYGGRGITVCSRWRESFEDFLADMGPRPGPEYSLDRIDNDGPYEPGNCRWATWEEQQNNRQACRPITIGGVTQTAEQWNRHFGEVVTSAAARERLTAGWPPQDAFTRPAAENRGETNGRAKLTEAKVLEILARRAAGESYGGLARAFGVSRPVVSDICLGKKWKHVVRAER